MSKYRMTDSAKWSDPWFMDLPSKYKLLWIYLTDECNIAGVWKVNFKMAQFCVGEHLEPSEVKRHFSGRVVFVNDEYWFIKNFVKFQQRVDITELNPSNKCHLGIIKKLNDLQQLTDEEISPYQGASKGLASPPSNSNSNSNSLVEGDARGRFKKPSEEELIQYLEENFCDALSREQILAIPKDFVDYYESCGWVVGKKKMKSWKHSLNRWARKQSEESQDKTRIGRGTRKQVSNALSADF